MYEVLRRHVRLLYMADFVYMRFFLQLMTTPSATTGKGAWGISLGFQDLETKHLAI